MCCQGKCSPRSAGWSGGPVAGRIFIQQQQQPQPPPLLCIYAERTTCGRSEKRTFTSLYLSIRKIYPEFFGTRVGCHVSAVEWV